MSGARYVLPRRRDPARWVFGLLGFGLGLFFIAVGVGWFFFTSRGQGPVGAWPPNLIQSLALLPTLGGAAKILEAILLVGGHAEVVLHAGKIWAVERFGPIAWWRSRPADRVRRFVLIYRFKIPGTGIEVTGESDGDASEEDQPKDPTAAIRVECQGAGTMLLAWDYPSRWLLSLSQNLANRWHESDFSQVFLAKHVPIEVVDSASPESCDVDSMSRADAHWDGRLAEDLGRTTILRRDLEARVNAELAADERIVWAGQPQPRWSKYVGAIPFGILWTMGVLVMGWFVLQELLLRNQFPDDATKWISWIFGVVFLLFLVPFLLVGILMLGAPYWKVLEARRTAYVLTNRRVFSVRPGRFRASRVTSYTADRLEHLRSVERSDGSGDLLFSADQSRRRQNEMSRSEAFWSVPAVRDVEVLVRKTLLAQ